jgi:hypothetical protein
MQEFIDGKEGIKERTVIKDRNGKIKDKKEKIKERNEKIKDRKEKT